MPNGLLLEGSLRSALERAVAEIADALVDPSDVPGEDHPSLSGGEAGRALFFHYLGHATGQRIHRERALAHLERCAAALASTPLELPLYSGLSGVAWLIAHLQRDVRRGEQYELADVDALLIEALDSAPERKFGFDLISGLVGVGVYFLERMPGRAAAEGLRRVVARLAACSESDGDGATWWTDPRWLVSYQRPQFPRGRYDLGVAHGCPGAIAFLAHACRHPAVADEARALLGAAVRWLLTRRFPAVPEHSYPHWFLPGAADAAATRAAWCYGDPGIACALLAAAGALGDPAVERIARHMALSSLSRDVVVACVVDAPLCHGSAGLAHLAHVLWHRTGDARLAAAAAYWLRVTLDFRKPDRGIAGFEYFRGADGAWQPDSTFLTGTSGIGLALVSALHAGDHSWDRLLLVS